MKEKLWFILILLITFLVFKKTIFLYFFQDDFFLLSISKVNNINDFLKFFIPLKEVIWYRPLSSQFFFFICRSLFGLNPFFYHLVMLVTHFLNIFIVFLLVKNLVNDEKTSLISAFIYAVNSTHFIAMSWSSTYSFILGPTFSLLTLFNYLKKKYLTSGIFFTLGLLTSEVVIWTIIPLFFITLFFQKRWEAVKLTFFLLVIVFYFILRYILFPVTYENAYKIIFNPFVSFALFKFYFYRIIGIPLLIRNMSFNLLKIIILLLSSIVILIPIISLFYKKLSSKLLFQEREYLGCKAEDETLSIVSAEGGAQSGTKYQGRKSVCILLLSIIIYLSFLSIFLFLPFHYSPHYLTFSLIGFSLLLGLTISKIKKIFQFIFLISYFSLQLLTIRQTYQTHWVVKRANLAKKLIEEKKLIHPVESEEYFALGAGKAIEVYFGESIYQNK